MTETRADNVTWLTQEAYDRLKNELDHLSGPGRIEIAQKIEAAREEGDLRENGGYHAAKEEQGKIEGRILQLQGGDDEEVTFLLASREEVGAPIDVYSPKSPLGAAIDGKKVGEKASYTLPNGRSMSVEILDATPYGGA